MLEPGTKVEVVKDILCVEGEYYFEEHVGQTGEVTGSTQNEDDPPVMYEVAIDGLRACFYFYEEELEPIG